MAMKKVHGLIAACILVACAVGLWIGRSVALIRPWEPGPALVWPSFVASDTEGTKFLIDDGLKKILSIAPDGSLRYLINGGDQSAGSFFYADELAPGPDGSVFVINRVMDPSGFFTMAAELVWFDSKGENGQALVRMDYDNEQRQPSLVQRGQWFGLSYRRGLLSWFDARPDGLYQWTLEAGADSAAPGTIRSGTPQVRAVLSLADADVLVSSADVAPDGSIFCLTKRGQLWKVSRQGSVELWLDSSRDELERLPWRIRSVGQGVIYSDLYRHGLFRLDAPDAEPLELLPDSVLADLGGDKESSLYLTLTVNEAGGIGAVSDWGAFVRDGSGTWSVASAPVYPLAWRLRIVAWWTIALLGFLTLLYLLRWVYVVVLKKKISRFAIRMTGVIALTVLVGVLVSYMVIGNFNKRYSDEVLTKISQIATLIPRLIDTDQLMSIETADQFMGPAYRSIRASMIDALYGDNFERNQGLYFALHRVNPLDGKLYTFMWLNGEPGIWQPYTYLWDPELAYQSSLEGETVAYAALDAFGSWFLATSPVINSSGTIVGVFEIGGDFYSFTQANNQLIRQLGLSIATVLVLLLIVMVEGGFLGELNKRQQNARILAAQGLEARRDEDVFHAVFLTRPISAVLFTALSMSLLFLPLLMKQLVDQSTGSFVTGFGLPESVVLSLPVSVRLLFFGAGTLVAGMLTGRLGWKTVFGIGVGLAAGGAVWSGLTASPDALLLAAVLIGLGTGLSTIGLRSVINHEPDSRVRSRAYSHFYSGLIAGTNLGVMIGQWLADLIGYSGVFLVSSVLIVLSLLAALYYGSPLPNRTRSEGRQRSALPKLLASPRVLVFFAAIILPIYVASMFLWYFLPWFSLGEGITNGDMGRIFLLNGLVIIYLGPALSGWLSRRIKREYGVALGSLLWAVSLVPFLVQGGLAGVVWTIVLMGLAEGVAVNFHNDYYLSLKAVKQVGEDQATGLFEVVGKIGETVAPVLIGFSLLLGPLPGFTLVAFAVLVGVALFLLVLFLAGPERRAAARRGSEGV